MNVQEYFFYFCKKRCKRLYIIEKYSIIKLGKENVEEVGRTGGDIYAQKNNCNFACIISLFKRRL